VKFRQSIYCQYVLVFINSLEYNVYNLDNYIVQGDSDEMADISDLLNEALEDPNSEPTPPKHRKNDAEDVGGPYPLYHSVSFYRKQKQVYIRFNNLQPAYLYFKKFKIQELTVTPVKQVVRNPEVQVESCSEEKANAAESQRVQINQQIRLYQEEVMI
jgi:hypothetical protein